jgi:peptidoglycan/LPS O-acetylase OafA/YrhL
MTPLSSPPRPRWYPITLAVLVLTVIVLVAVALTGLISESDDSYGLVGFFTGLCSTLAVALVAVTEIGRRNEAQLRDAAALDDLEPLRAAGAGHTADARAASGDDEARP